MQVIIFCQYTIILKFLMHELSTTITMNFLSKQMQTTADTKEMHSTYLFHQRNYRYEIIQKQNFPISMHHGMRSGTQSNEELVLMKIIGLQYVGMATSWEEFGILLPLLLFILLHIPLYECYFLFDSCEKRCITNDKMKKKMVSNFVPEERRAKLIVQGSQNIIMGNLKPKILRHPNKLVHVLSSEY